MIKATTQKERKVIFPKLMSWKEGVTEVVILFNSERSGTVLKSNYHEYTLGSYMNNVDARDSRWSIFTGEITLENI